MGPQDSITSAATALAEWNPNPRRVMSRTRLLSLILICCCVVRR
jgi:hypothetical protein